MIARSWRAVAPFAIGSILAIGALGATGGAAAASLDPADATVHTKVLTFGEDGFRAGTVRCPQGKRAISGGAAFQRPGLEPVVGLHAKLISSSPTKDGRGWHAAGSSFEDEDPIELRITVACLPGGAVGSYTVRTRDLLADDQLHYAGSLGCGTGLRLVTGGAFWNPGPEGPQPTPADNLLRSTPSPDGKRWLVRGFDAGGAGDVLRIVLLCRPASAVGPLTIRHRDILSTDDRRGGTVACGTGKRALTGGVDWYQDGSPIATGSMTSSTVRANLKGWFAAGSLLSDTIGMRITVICIPA